MTGVFDFRVRYAETDQMGRAHHRHYLVWCESGRTALMRGNGVSYAELERAGVLLPVSRVEIEYRAPVAYDDEVRLYTRVDRLRSREIVFAYRFVKRVDGALVARARIHLVCADSEGRPTRLPAKVRETLGRLAGATPDS
ncbi:MAG: acyl-CoA thioesterase [Gemmatimonadetes bacterium]|nr:acyl-CoA thioesterase [Gemmatimonadota bacterium]